MPSKTSERQTQKYILKTTTVRCFKIILKTPPEGTRREEEEEIGKVDETSDLELPSNLCSSTELEQETKEHNGTSIICVDPKD